MALANPDYVSNHQASLRGGMVQLVSLGFMFWLSVYKPLKGRGKGAVNRPETGGPGTGT
jgi:hypothetical protein